MEIIKLSEMFDLVEKEKNLEEVKEIFFLSSSVKEFQNEDRKNAFFKRWCGDYVKFYAENFYLFRENKRVLGYLSGCRDSEKSLKILDIPGVTVFQDLFSLFPAHLHINFHPDARGRGLGSLLIKRYCEDLRASSIVGVHLITSPEALNVSFYLKLEFSHQVPRLFKQSTLLFMGKKLD